MSEVLLAQIANDLQFIKGGLAELKEEVNDIRDREIELRPEYLEKLIPRREMALSRSNNRFLVD